MSTIDDIINVNDINIDNGVTTPPSTTITTTTTSTVASATPETMTFSLSAHRQLFVDRNSIVVRDEITRKFANLSPQRWAKLREVTNDVDVAVERLVKKDENVFYRRHLGGTWFVTIRSGVWCVDIRKHFNCSSSSTHIDGVDDDLLVVNEDSIDDGGNVVDRLNLKPTRIGLGLRIREWRALKEIGHIVDSVHPDIADAQPCFHLGQAGKLNAFLSQLLLLLLSLQMSLLLPFSTL